MRRNGFLVFLIGCIQLCPDAVFFLRSWYCHQEIQLKSKLTKKKKSRAVWLIKLGVTVQKQRTALSRPQTLGGKGIATEGVYMYILCT